jgi:hypothetical protein
MPASDKKSLSSFGKTLFLWCGKGVLAVIGLLLDAV